MSGQTQEQKQQQQKEYNEYVKQVTPTHNLWANMGKAFVTGGIICTIAQFILNTCANYGLDKTTSGSWCSLILILCSGCKICTMAGPVILYGIFSSWVLGLIYWVLKLWGMV